MIKRLMPLLMAFGLFIVVAAIFFYPQLQGQRMIQSDILMHKGMSHESAVFKENTGDQALWTNSMFGGMPTYQVSLADNGNLISKVHWIFAYLVGYPMGMILIGMFSFFILTRVLELEFWISIIGAIGFALTSNNIILIEAGHNTKVVAVYLLGITTAGILHAFKKNWLEGSIIFAFGLGYNIYINHPQMTYYFGLTLLILGGIFLYEYWKEGTIKKFIKPALSLIVAALLAASAQTCGLWTTYEYSKSSMRGAPILTTQNAETSSSAVEGLDWQYAMQWSNGFIDVMAGFIPGIAGGGSQEPVSTNSETYQAFRQAGLDLGRNPKASLYWGALPFTSGPAYFGSVFLFFFLLGMLLKNTRFKWWIGASVLLTLMLSMGKNLEWFNRIFFDYFPVFNKFRAPSSITSVTSFFIPLLAVITISDIIMGKVDRKELIAKGKIALGVVGGVCLFFAFMGPNFFDFTSLGDARLASQYRINTNALVADRQSLMNSDSLRTLGLILVAAGAVWAWTKQMINEKVLLALLGILIIYDMWSIDRRYVTEENFAPATQYEQNFTPRQADQQILADPDLHYRVMDYTTSPFQDAKPAYFHKLIGGYHGAKLQRANDLIERHISQGNQAVLNMLNMKYQIINNGGQVIAQRNPGALGNAWFVSNIQNVNSAQEEIDALNGLDPSNRAIVHSEFADYIAGLTLNKNGTIQLMEYSPNTLVYKSNSNSEQLAIFSEMWYEPGWEVSIDDQPLDHIRANYALRALRVPAGQHTITFDFRPKSYTAGKTISMTGSLLIFAGLGFLFYNRYQDFQQMPPPGKPVEKPAKPKPRATTARKKKKKKK
ncbi:MAG: YfhO family protein [Bacteroidia bacterium]|nr:YfhO family protein [Bacteroidia bacterium]